MRPRAIISGSEDKTIRLWDTCGGLKFEMKTPCHSEWVSCVRISPTSELTMVSCSWDKTVKVWDMDYTAGARHSRLKFNLSGHTGYLRSLSISPHGYLCASGGKDGWVFLWHLPEGN